ncbi:hypothetical protein [Cohnella yongneupensis]|uniref:HTH cro/C1-type domain-containing protein n=1 Tax=Cohnella yongneupensis TaxID=425006 RepID=A0ABW0QZS6_9BACL
MSIEIRDPVVKNIRHHLLVNEVQFSDVAASSGIEVQRFYAIIGGRARMSPVEFGAIAKALGLSMESFLPKIFLTANT